MGSYTPPRRRVAADRRPGRRPDFRFVAAAIALPTLALLGFFAYRAIATERAFVFTARQQRGPVIPHFDGATPAVNPELDAPAPPPGVPAQKQPSSRSSQNARRASHRVDGKRIAIILDDIGYENQPLERVARIDPNFSYSIIPGTPRGTEASALLSSRGFEILCHLPMEPIDYPRTKPGNGAILVSMSDEEIRAATREQFRAISGAQGVNNHMGSRATADRRVMGEVLAAVREEGAFFVDSRTSPRSVGFELARGLGVPTAARDIFLDDDDSEAAVRRQLEKLAATAESRGTAVGIGHVYPSTVRVLQMEIPRLRERGFEFVRVSEIVE
ncbi:MAG: divergent polysaccharide deacetylase family protein [Thermoanaerobaculia bacterium]